MKIIIVLMIVWLFATLFDVGLMIIEKKQETDETQKIHQILYNGMRFCFIACLVLTVLILIFLFLT